MTKKVDEARLEAIADGPGFDWLELELVKRKMKEGWSTDRVVEEVNRELRELIANRTVADGPGIDWLELKLVERKLKEAWLTDEEGFTEYAEGWGTQRVIEEVNEELRELIADCRPELEEASARPESAA